MGSILISHRPILDLRNAERIPLRRRVSMLSLSVLFHIALLAVSVWRAPPPMLEVRADPINVVLISQIPVPQAEMLQADEPTHQELSADAANAENAANAGSDEISQTVSMVRATEFHASSVLNDPRNVEVRENFPRLHIDERIVQLCNIEALEQFRRAEQARAANVIVGYAYAPISVVQLMLTAEGGAVRIGSKWRHVRYRCAVTQDVQNVTLFEYELGADIPEDEWEDHYLNADDEWGRL